MWPLAVLLLLVLAQAGVFVLMTTEYYPVEIGTGSWVFFLCASLAVMVAVAVKSTSRRRLRLVEYAVLAGLLVSTTVLGVRFRPFQTTECNLGLVPTDMDNLPSLVAPFQVLDVPVPKGEINHRAVMGAPYQQGCDDCWAVSAAKVISARHQLKIGKRGPAFVCTPKFTDVSTDHASAQAIVDRDPREGCGKCTGNLAHAGFVIAADGVPGLSCVPYFLGSRFYDSGGCLTSCGSPPADAACRGECIRGEGEVWFSCADGRPFPGVVRTKNIHYVEGEENIMRELANGGPVLCAVRASYPSSKLPDWTLQTATFGFVTKRTVSAGYIARPKHDGAHYYNEPLGEGDIGHAMVIYGFGELDGVKFWRVRNSWGADWGNGGDILIERGVNAWGIESQCVACDVVASPS